jgi:hypothetical protein
MPHHFQIPNPISPIRNPQSPIRNLNSPFRIPTSDFKIPTSEFCSHLLTFSSSFFSAFRPFTLCAMPYALCALLSTFHLPHSAFRIPHSKDSFQQRIHFAHDLLVFVPLQINGLGRAFGNADAASMAQGRVDFTDAVGVDPGYIERTGANTNQAGCAFFRGHSGRNR